MLVVTHGASVGQKESEFEVRDYDEGGYQAVRVHPWRRKYRDGEIDESVFVSVGNYLPNGEEDRLADEESVWNIIVSKTEFVEGLLAVVPELKRADDQS